MHRFVQHEKNYIPPMSWSLYRGSQGAKNITQKRNKINAKIFRSNCEILEFRHQLRRVSNARFGASYTSYHRLGKTFLLIFGWNRNEDG